MQRKDETVDRAIGALLRAGVLAACAVVLAGGIWYLASVGGAGRDFRAFHGEPHELRSAAAIFRGIFAWRPLTLIQFGLLLLIATPIARVGFSVVAFALQRDRTYVLITLAVLGILLCSLGGVLAPTH